MNDFLSLGRKEAVIMCNKKENTMLPEYIVDPTTKTTYLKGKFIGKGGFARVHELTDLTTNKLYAGKIVPKYRLLKTYQKEKMLREIELHRTFQHPNIVQFHHFFGDTNNIYIILEYCSRKSLVHVLKNRKVLTEPEVRYYLRHLCEGVQYIHGKNVIHRDLKLGNMLLTESMKVKIADFGLASRLSKTVPKKPTVCGTPNYIAPEVLNRKGHGFEADIWAIGCIMYAMLVGLPPFESSSLSETYTRITSNCYYIPGHISKPAQDLIQKLLQGDPAERPTLSEILQHEFFHSGYSPETLPTSCCSVPPKFPNLPLPLVTRSPKVSPTPTRHSDTQSITQGLAALNLPTSNPAKEEPKKDGKKDLLFHTSLRQKLSSILCIDKTKKMKTSITQVMYQKVLHCIENMPKDIKSPVPVVYDAAPLCVTKWIDYSNKYGFGFQLSDQTIGILFNDSTKMCLSADRMRTEFYDTSGKMSYFVDDSTIPTALEHKVGLLRYFTNYMDENLTEGGNLVQEGAKKRGPMTYMKLWLRINQAIIMHLSTGTLQVNFFKDHTKIIVSVDVKKTINLTYIDEEKTVATYSLDDITVFGCSKEIHKRLQYVLWVLQEFVNLENED